MQGLQQKRQAVCNKEATGWLTPACLCGTYDHQHNQALKNPRHAALPPAHGLLPAHILQKQALTAASTIRRSCSPPRRLLLQLRLQRLVTA
jgi:hypothetical protein